MNDLSASLSPPPLPPALGLLVLLLGAYVCIAMGQRVRQRAAAERLPWLLASAMALATGLWAAAVLGVASLKSSLDIGFDAHTVGGAGLAAFVLGLPGLYFLLSAPAARTWRLGGAFNCGKAQPGQVAPVSHGCPSALFRGINVLNTRTEGGR